MEVIALSEYLFTEPAMEIFHFVLLCTTEFLNLCTIDIWGQILYGVFCALQDARSNQFPSSDFAN